ncbi:choice-of-anchor M domain-containing protein [Gleimia sp. 6138-11-ORH1]|uniref:choice-of-anchor M domain-containing protein n=1 Tax=Gleimia sp. 6138-11-ORH1 TaxID=2973937 RepID=UPI002168510E|nr:choice-of-anchor M domain-containing protein [Gleimia sp. 6138-11-ORH1]MCS4484076.1 choice-of-anchor M domain-containing protein [Gleimia sp. 6138-11-ORH1]
MRKLSKTLSTLTAVGALTLTSIAAHAAQTPEPPTYSENHKYVYSRTHVDAPKVYWDPVNQRFQLLTNYATRNSAGEIDEHTIPIDYALNWVGKGWRGRTPAHIFQVPNHPSLAHLGTAGTILYASPQIAGSYNTPIWAGLGADSQIPTEQFRDGEFSLNLIGIDGPGKVEYFITGPSGELVRRLFSSHDTKYRETLLQPAQHTHNFTTFSKPGTYRIYFQAFARDKVGNPIVSPPQVHEWRVGGNDPRLKTHLKDFRKAFQSAPVSNHRNSTPSFQMLPKTPERYENPGDQYYTDFKFTTGNPADSGTLVVTIDGFELIQLPVENGIATGSEMLGDETANYQAIFIPAGSAPTGRWVSEQFSYQRTQPGVEQTQETSEIAPENALNPAPVYPLQATELNDLQVDMEITPVADQPGKYLVKIAGRDPKFKGHVRGGFKEKPKQFHFDCFLDADLVAGSYQRVHDFSYCQKDFHLSLNISPFPSINAKGTTYTQQVDLTQGTTATFSLEKQSYTKDFPSFDPPKKEEVPGDPLDKEPPQQPQPPKEQPQVPSPGNPELKPPIDKGGKAGSEIGKPKTPEKGKGAGDSANPKEAELTLTKGHLDISAKQNAKELGIIIKDDTLEHASQTRIPREPETITLSVPRAAKQTRTTEQGEARFDFLGKIGETFYLLPEVQDNQLLWPGFSTEEIDYQNYPEGLDFVITPLDTPAEGKAVGFSVDPFADADQSVTTFFDTTKPGKYRLQTTEPTHRHLNWLFTKAGTYELAVQLYSGTRPLGKPSHLKFHVDTVQKQIDKSEKDHSKLGKEPLKSPSEMDAPNREKPQLPIDTNLGQAPTVNGAPPAITNNAPQNIISQSQLPNAAQPIVGRNQANTPNATTQKQPTPQPQPAELNSASESASAQETQGITPAKDPYAANPTTLNARDWAAIGISLSGVLLLLAGLILIYLKSAKPKIKP